MNARTVPLCNPMMIRKITPRKGMEMVGGVLVLEDYDVDDVGVVESRLPFDADVVDCSNRIFQITTAMMMNPTLAAAPISVFPSRRWRNFRTGDHYDGLPSPAEPLLYLGNPVRIYVDDGVIHVERLPEFLIKSGMELGY